MEREGPKLVGAPKVVVTGAAGFWPAGRPRGGGEERERIIMGIVSWYEARARKRQISAESYNGFTQGKVPCWWQSIWLSFCKVDVSVPMAFPGWAQ